MQEPLVLLVISFAVLFLLLALGVKIGIALAMVGVIGFFIYKGDAGLTALVPFRTLDSFVLTAIPLFIFMGEVLVQSGASAMIYRGTSRLLAWLPGGLLHTNIGACAMFASISGSSPATAATIGSVAIPALKERNYDRELILGSLACGGTLGILIPPSGNLIVYGMLSEQSVGRLFAAGMIPGIILSIFFMIYIGFAVLRNPQKAPKELAFSIKGMALGLKDLWPLFVMAFIVLGGIFGGVMTPTEAAAVGTAAALVLAVVLRTFSWRLLRGALARSVETTCMVGLIIVGASLMGSFFSLAGIPGAVAALVMGLDISKWLILTSIYIAYLFLGCFIDPVSIIIMTASTVLPIIRELGFDLIWFGVAYVVTAEIGMVTPPMGLNLFVIQGISGEDLGRVVKGSLPFYFEMVLVLVLVTAFPIIALWLPNLFFGSMAPAGI